MLDPAVETPMKWSLSFIGADRTRVAKHRTGAGGRRGRLRDRLCETVGLSEEQALATQHTGERLEEAEHRYN
jgi:hypothetical protein